MWTAALALLKPLLPYAIGLALVAALWGAHKVDVAYQHHAGYVQGKAEIQAAWDKDKAERKAQTDALAKAWDAERAAADDATRKLTEANDARFNDLAKQAHSLPGAVAAVRVPDGALSLFDRAVQAANTAGPPAEPQSPAARPSAGATVGDLTAWGVDAARLYRACRDRVDALTAYYQSIRSHTQEKP